MTSKLSGERGHREVAHRITLHVAAVKIRWKWNLKNAMTKACQSKKNGITCMSLLVGGNKKNLLKNIVAKASPSPNCWGIYALLCSFKLQKPSAHWSFSGKGFKCTHIVNPLYISSVANNVLRRGSILCLYLTMFTSAFTECDNPFSMESDPLEQRLKGVCVCVCELMYVSMSATQLE